MVVQPNRPQVGVDEFPYGFGCQPVAVPINVVRSWKGVEIPIIDMPLVSQSSQLPFQKEVVSVKLTAIDTW